MNDDGKFTPADFREWRLIQADCKLGSDVGGACPAVLDITDDGLVTREDIVTLAQRHHFCMLQTDLGRQQ
jgi:hypothetical protein